jgi:hypothetical protein
MSDDATVPLSDDACPDCRAPINAATPTPGTVMEPVGPGDFAICTFCASVLVFDAAMRLRHVRPADITTLSWAEAEEIEMARQYIVRVLTRERRAVAMRN